MKNIVAVFGLAIMSVTQAAKFPLVRNEPSLASIGAHVNQMTARLVGGEAIPVSNKNDWSYAVPVEIGTPPQTFLMAPDVYSTDSWVYSKKCWSMPCFWMDLFDGSKSSTYLGSEGKPFTKPMPDYRRGMAIGNLSQDTFRLSDSLEVQNFTFGEVTKIYGNEFVFNGVSGILGLAYNTKEQSAIGAESFLTQASPADKSFSLYLHKNPEKSFLVVPGMDSDHYEVIKEHKVTNKTAFQLKFDGVKKGDLHVKDEGTTVAIASTFDGMPAIVGSQKVLGSIMDEVVVYKDCSNVDELPDITIVIDGVDYTLSGRDYVVKSRGQCQNGFVVLPPSWPGTPAYPYLTLGNIFLQKFYPYFDMNKDTVSFQREKDPEQIGSAGLVGESEGVESPFLQ